MKHYMRYCQKEEVEKYNQYNNTKQFEYLLEALAKDNINSDILYEYLHYLCKSNPTLYKWRRLFLKREHMITKKCLRKTQLKVNLKIFEKNQFIF